MTAKKNTDKQPSTFVEETVQESITEAPTTTNQEESITFSTPEQPESTEEEQQSVPAPTTNSPPKMITIETPIGTEMQLTEEEAKRLMSAGNESEWGKELNEVLVNVSKERLDEITDGLKKGVLKLKYVDKGKVIPNNIDYVPITYGQNKKVNRIMKRTRIMREDINECLAGNLELKDLISKYPEIIDEDTGKEELRSPALLNEYVGNFVIAQKANIYWGIDEIEKYVLSDLVLIIGLYERRNSYTNT